MIDKPDRAPDHQTESIKVWIAPMPEDMPEEDDSIVIEVSDKESIHLMGFNKMIRKDNDKVVLGFKTRTNPKVFTTVNVLRYDGSSTEEEILLVDKDIEALSQFYELMGYEIQSFDVIYKNLMNERETILNLAQQRREREKNAD